MGSQGNFFPGPEVAAAERALPGALPPAGSRARAAFCAQRGRARAASPPNDQKQKLDARNSRREYRSSLADEIRLTVRGPARRATGRLFSKRPQQRRVVRAARHISPISELLSSSSSSSSSSSICTVPASCLLTVAGQPAACPNCLYCTTTSSDKMSVCAGQGGDEVLVSQAVWDYLATAGRPWLLDFEERQELSVGIARRGERGGCCTVRLQPVEGRSGAGGELMGQLVSPATRRAFMDLCRCARKEMSKQDGAPKRKRSLLPCVGGMEADGEGSLLPPAPPQPRRSQRQQQQQQRHRHGSDVVTCVVLPMALTQPRGGLEVGGPAVATSGAAATAAAPSEEENRSCSICMGEMVEKTMLDKCGHAFCRSCLDQAFRVKRACPVCRRVYGQLIGNQPANGTMMVERDLDLELQGHEGYGCICIIYSFPPGLQAQEHPNPGVRYPGTNRIAYLPDSPEGNRVLGLLRRAFEQRLTFTIGTSMTTGMQNVITWNDIHHKTSIWGGPRCFGYPDPTYLVRVTEELREKGITAD